MNILPEVKLNLVLMYFKEPVNTSHKKHITCLFWDLISHCCLIRRVDRPHCQRDYLFSGKYSFNAVRTTNGILFTSIVLEWRQTAEILHR